MSKMLKKKDRQHYGVNYQQPDIDPVGLSRLCQETVESLQMTNEQTIKIKENMGNQWKNDLWIKMRKQRFTASKFGEVCKKRKTTPCHRLVKEIIYPFTNEKKSASLSFGINHEKDAVSQYMAETGNKVSPAGLFISHEYGFLDASRDDIVEDSWTSEKGLLEIKCYYSATDKGLRERNMAYTPREAAHLFKGCPLKATSTGQLMLVENKSHYFQVQGALQIARVNWCDYAAWTPSGIYIQRIQRDNHFWEKKMLPNLKWFFYNCMLPELASLRYLMGAPIQEPEDVVIKQKKT